MIDDYQMQQQGKQNSIQTKSSSLMLPNNWICQKHDKALLQIVSDKGFGRLNEISERPELSDIDINPETASKRIEDVCEFFKELHQQSKVVKKPKRDMNSFIA